MNDEQLIEQLQAFGIGRIEATIYLHLVNKQPKTIVEIAHELDLPRTSIYDNSLKLAEKGLVQKIITHKSQKLQAYPLGILQEFIDKEKSRVDQLQHKMVDLEKRIALVATAPINTEVRYYYGKKGIQQMLWNSLKAHKELVGYSQFGRIEVVGETFSTKHAAETIKRGIKDRVITNPKPEMLQYLRGGPLSKQRQVFQTTRVLDMPQLYVSGDTSIYNNIFAVIYWKQGEVVGVEIENAELVKTQRSIFEQMWLLAKPVKEYL
jgi:sugar-specific transcriptional regulator TrmB